MFCSSTTDERLSKNKEEEEESESGSDAKKIKRKLVNISKLQQLREKNSVR